MAQRKPDPKGSDAQEMKRIREAIRQELSNLDLDALWENAQMSDEDVQAQIQEYEQQYQMSSEEFLKRWKDGTVPDTFETNDWYILLTFRENDDI